MNNVSEKKVQDVSLEFLREYYINKYHPSRMYCKDEAYTKKRKRADGLLCFHSEEQKYHMVSMEAKSHKTLNSLQPEWDTSLMDRKAVLLSLLAIITAAYFSIGLEWYWIMSIVLGAGIGGLLSYYFYTEFAQPTGLKLSGVIKQIGYYPANEQWLAVSSDSMDLVNKASKSFRDKTSKEVLYEICEKRGIGLIVVSRKAKVHLYPSFNEGNFVNDYLYSEAISKKVDAYSKRNINN